MTNSKLNVWLLDPAQLTPYYNVTLADALVQTGCNVRYIASPYLYDTNLSYSDRFKVDYLYFKGLHNPKLIRYPNLRRILRGISYPLGHLQLIRQLRQNRPDILHIQWSRVPYFDYRLKNNCTSWYALQSLLSNDNAVTLIQNCKESTTCSAPGNRQARNITATDAKLTWKKGSCENTHQVKHRKSSV